MCESGEKQDSVHESDRVLLVYLIYKDSPIREAVPIPMHDTKRIVMTTRIMLRINCAIAQFLRERFSEELLTAQTIKHIKPTNGMQVRISVISQSPTDMSVSGVE